MAKKKSEVKPDTPSTPTEAEIEAERIRVAREAKRAAKAAAAEAKALAKKNVMGPQHGARKNPFSAPGKPAKAMSIPRSIISRARGGRSR